MHLAHHPSTVLLNGDFADAELTADLLVQQAENHQRHDFPFAMAEGLVASTERLQVRLLFDAYTAAFQRDFDCAQEHGGHKGFGQKLDSSCFHCLNCHRYIAATGDEDNRHVCALTRDPLLKLETIEVRQTDIKNQATRGRWWWTGKKLRRAGEKRAPPAIVCDEKCQRIANRNVVVNNDHKRFDARHGEQPRRGTKVCRCIHIRYPLILSPNTPDSARDERGVVAQYLCGTSAQNF